MKRTVSISQWYDSILILHNRIILSSWAKPHERHTAGFCCYYTHLHWSFMSKSDFLKNNTENYEQCRRERSRTQQKLLLNVKCVMLKCFLFLHKLTRQQTDKHCYLLSKRCSACVSVSKQQACISTIHDCDNSTNVLISDTQKLIKIMYSLNVL